MQSSENRPNHFIVLIINLTKSVYLRVAYAGNVSTVLEREPIYRPVTTHTIVGVDIAKNVMQLYWMNPDTGKIANTP